MPSPVAEVGAFSSVLPVTASAGIPACAARISISSIISWPVGSRSTHKALTKAIGRAPEHSTSNRGTRTPKCATVRASTLTESAGLGPIPPIESQASTNRLADSKTRRSRNRCIMVLSIAARMVCSR